MKDFVGNMRRGFLRLAPFCVVAVPLASLENGAVAELESSHGFSAESMAEKILVQVGRRGIAG